MSTESVTKRHVGSMNQHWLGRQDAVATLIVASTLALVYLWRLLPSISRLGDVTKFQFVGHTAGTVHETGYPVYLVLLWIATHVPLGSVAERSNALSGLFAAISGALVYLIARRLGVRTSIAAATSIGLGLSPVILFFSVITEVYTLHLMLSLGIVLALIVWEQDRRPWLLWIVIVLVAISFGNHMTTSLMVPAILLFLWSVDRRAAFNRWTLLAGALGGAAAVLSYGYVIWRASDPSTFYVEIAPRSFFDMIDVWLGGRFRGRVFGLPLAEVLTDRVPRVLSLLAASFLALIPFVVIGLRALRSHAVRRLLMMWFLTVLAFAVGYDIPDIEPYAIPLLVCLGLATAVGIEEARRRWLRTDAVFGVVLGVIVIAIAAPTAGIALTDWADDEAFETEVTGWLQRLGGSDVLVLGYSGAHAAWNLVTIGDIESPVNVMLVEVPDLDADHLTVIEAYQRGEPHVSPRTGDVIEPGLSLFAGPDGWMCALVASGFALEPATGELYRIVSSRWERPIENRWSGEMRSICIAIDADYGDATSSLFGSPR